MENNRSGTVDQITASTTTIADNVTNSKRKRRCTIDERESDYQRPSKRPYSSHESSSHDHHHRQSDFSEDNAITTERYPESVDYELLCTLVSPPSLGDLLSPAVDDFDNWARPKGDTTPHAASKSSEWDNKSTQTKNTRREVPSMAEMRACPLPPVSWADSKDVWRLMCRKDEMTSLERSPKMLANHPGLQSRMRAILLDWLIEVCEVYKLHRETYYLAVDYLDRFLSSHSRVSKTCLQLIGITCLFVAAKVEEIYPPKIGEFAYVTDGACTEEDILQQELLLLEALNWRISPVTIIGWLGVYMQLDVTNRPITQRVPSSSSQSSAIVISVDSTPTSADCGKVANLSPTKMKGTSNNTTTTALASASPSASTTTTTTATTTTLMMATANSDSFIYPQFSGMEFAQTAQLIDLCSLDLGLANFPYSVIAAAAMSHTFTRATAMKASGFDWATIGPCARWMEPFFRTICKESQPIFLLEQNEQVKSKFGLGHICPNIVTDDSHIIQTHTTSLDMFDIATIAGHDENATLATIIGNEASPVPVIDRHTCPAGMLTPPASSRKSLGSDSNNECDGDDGDDGNHDDDGGGGGDCEGSGRDGSCSNADNNGGDTVTCANVGDPLEKHSIIKTS